MSFGHRRDRERELDEEIRSHFRMAVEERIARGESPEEAERAVRREFGNEVRVREVTRTMWGGMWLDRLAQDLRFGLRVLRRDPTFAVLTVLTFAVGVGASTAIFSAAAPVLISPLDYPNADRIFLVHDLTSDGDPMDVTFGTFREMAERSRSFDALAVLRGWRPSLGGVDTPERLEGQAVSADYFSVLGLSPVLGRAFQPSDDRMGGPQVVILSHSLWQRRFSGDSAIVGREVRLDDRAHTIVGVMRADFVDALNRPAEIWTPLQYDAALPLGGREWGHHLRMVGRTRSGLDAEQADAELDAIAASPVDEISRPAWASLSMGLDLDPLADHVTRAARPVVLAVVAAALLLLAIACVNVTNLLFARGIRRRGELAVRAAIGAGRGRIVRQMVTECLVLATLGGVLGTAVAVWGLDALRVWDASAAIGTDALRVDLGALGLTSALIAVLAVVVALLPAFDATREGRRRHLLRTARGVTAGHRRVRGTLVVGEVAITLILLVGAGLLLRSARALLTVDPGFDASSVLTLQVQTSGPEYAAPDATNQYFEDALAAVRRVPGVVAAGLTSQLPLSGEDDRYGVQTENAVLAGTVPQTIQETDVGVFRYTVSAGYFDAMGIQPRSGRVIVEDDVANAGPVVVVSESLARRRFPGQDPIGKRIHVGRTDLPWLTVVGVVDDVKQTSLAVGSQEGVYVASEQWYFADAARWLVVRTNGDPGAFVSAVQEAIRSVDPERPIVRVAELGEVVSEAADVQRFAWVLFGVFGLAALGLAAIGLYGVLSGSVTERARELGVRSALGATRSDILTHVARDAVIVGGAGLALGLLGATALGRALDRLLFEVSPLDPATYAAVVGLLAMIAAIAYAGPAARAAGISPTAALREE